MTRQCKDCVFGSKNKLREVIKDVISCVDNEHTRLEQRLIAAEQSEQEASEIIAELKAEKAKLKEENFKLGQLDIKKVTLVENRQLEAENETLKSQLDFAVQQKEVFEAENVKLKEALKKINSIIDNDFINCYMELSFNEYDDILEKIGKVCEVLKDENE